MKSITKFLLSTFILLIAFSGALAQDAIEFPTPCSIDGPKYGEDSATAVKNLSLYRENFKQWKSSGYTNDAIDYAIDGWRYCLLHAPLSSQHIYFDGVKIVEHLIAKAEKAGDSLLREKYIDTLFLVYDIQIKAFGCKSQYGEAFILGRKGRDMIQYRKKDPIPAYLTLKRSIDLDPDNAEAGTISIFYKILEFMVKTGKADTTLIFDYYDVLISAANKQIKKYKQLNIDKPEDSVKNNKFLAQYMQAESNVNSLFDPWANCEQIMMIYTPKFDENKDDVAWLAKLVGLMYNKGCTDNELYFAASEARYELEPSPAAALDLGKAFYKAKKYAEAIKYLKIATEGLEDPLEKAEAYLVIATSYKELGQYSNARAAALRCAELDPTNGKPYILIGDMYAATAASCGDNPVSQRAGYWTAADKYAKAKSVSNDEKIIDIATQKYNAAYAGFPTTEDIFFYGFNKGDSYTVSCWYTESTVIRSRD